MKIFDKEQDRSPFCRRTAPGGSRPENERSAPRLVINDAVAVTKVLVAKTRSEIGGLDSLLRNLTKTPLRSK